MKIPEIRVIKNISGSHVVVELGSKDHYIDARVDERYPGMSFIELVQAGQVRQAESVPDEKAPEVIMAIARKALNLPAH